jgi:hypothetical protein
LAEIRNLRQARKRRARQAKSDQAAINRAAFGRSGTERAASEAEQARQVRDLDAHRREPAGPDGKDG